MKHLIVDSGAIIKGTLKNHLAENYWTTTDVLNEIRDKKARYFLENLPFELQVKEPSNESLAFVKAFAQKTGDLGFLSLTDLRVLALTYQMEVEETGGHDLRHAPAVISKCPSRASLKKSDDDDGDRVLPLDQLSLNEDTLETRNPKEEETLNQETSETQNPKEEETLNQETSETQNPKEEENLVDIPETLEQQDTRHEPEAERRPTHEEEEARKEFLPLDWIDASNFQQFQDHWNSGRVRTKAEAEAQVPVACITTDYAMQNVLLQIGLHLSSTDGRKIVHVKKWILQCVGCFTLVQDTCRLFCPKCGGATLERVSVSTNQETGQVSIYRRPRQQQRASKLVRGSKFSIPKSKTSDRKRDPGLLLREDQLLMGIWGQRHLTQERRANKQELSQVKARIVATEQQQQQPRNNKGGGVLSSTWDHHLDLLSRSSSGALDSCKIQFGHGRKNPNAQRGRERRGKTKKKQH